jgi:hypothetical protein
VRLAIAALKLLHPTSPVAPFLTVSVGVATASVEGYHSPEALIAAADGDCTARNERGGIARSPPTRRALSSESGGTTLYESSYCLKL